MASGSELNMKTTFFCLALSAVVLAACSSSSDGSAAGGPTSSASSGSGGAGGGSPTSTSGISTGTGTGGSLPECNGPGAPSTPAPFMVDTVQAKLLDATGAPVANSSVQVCGLDICEYGTTNASGDVTVSVMKSENN